MKLHQQLEKIVQQKKQEVEQLQREVFGNPKHPLQQILDNRYEASGKFAGALKKNELAIIAEIKRCSPSVGNIRSIENPLNLSLKYCHGGASVISVLTDHLNFGGSINDLKTVAEGLKESFPKVAVLRKDFIIHPLQLAEAAFAGAHAVLLIAGVVKGELTLLLQEAKRLGLEVLTEVHDAADLEIALEAQAPIIGINHRNLQTFEIDLSSSEKLIPLIPSHVIKIAESGIHLTEQAIRMRELGFDAILVGEALVRSEDPSDLIRKMRGKTFYES